VSVRVISWVLNESPLEHRGDLLVLLVLADHAHDDGGGAYPSVATIAKKARLTRRGTQLALRRLTDGGAIEEVGIGPQRTVVYRVIMRHEGEVSSQGEVTSRANSATREGEVSAPGGANPRSPKPSIEPSVVEPPPRPPASGGSVFPGAVPSSTRRRDQQRWQAEVTAFAAARFPTASREDAAAAVVGAIRTGGATSIDEVDAWLARWRPDIVPKPVGQLRVDHAYPPPAKPTTEDRPHDAR
jgi:hypothetical protein